MRGPCGGALNGAGRGAGAAGGGWRRDGAVRSPREAARRAPGPPSPSAGGGLQAPAAGGGLGRLPLPLKVIPRRRPGLLELGIKPCPCARGDGGEGGSAHKKGPGAWPVVLGSQTKGREGEGCGSTPQPLRGSCPAECHALKNKSRQD